MNNEKQIVALSIDKVQTFLTEAIHAHVQEKQTEEATLRQIMNASREISIDFQNTVKEAFSIEEELLSCSGVYVFSSLLPPKEINDIFNKLFLKYYQESQGQKWLRCVSFPKGNYNEIQAIQEAKKRLKQSDCLNARIKENRDVLFSFCKVNGKDDRQEKKYESYPMFAKNINALFSEDEADNENRFRIAVIKADLDGMGNMFKAIQDYDTYQEISRILNEKVSLDGLHEMAKAYGPKDRTGWLFPFYIAGDDIFFAVSAANLIKGLHLCQEIRGSINGELKKKNLQKLLSISIGVEITFNREPIRYYMDMVERQLKCAKEGKVPDSLNPFVMAKISIGGQAFLDIDYNAVKKYKGSLKKTERGVINEELRAVPIWDFFLNDVYRLNAIRADEKYSELLGTSGFFYTLLDRLSDEAVQRDDAKYISSVLYHLLPKYLSSSDQRLRNLEVILNGRILSQLMYKKSHEGMHLDLNKESKLRLETYLRLMLLFSDKRFRLNSDLKSKLRYTAKDLDDARKYLFSKSADYLYEKVLSSHKPLRNLFIKKVEYKTENGKSIWGFQRLQLEKSMFVRMRDTSKVCAEKAANMIAMKNPDDKEIIDELNEGRRSDKKIPYHLYFDKQQFLKQAKRKDAWNSDFIDSLMLFYQCIELAIRFKATSKEKGGNSK